VGDAMAKSEKRYKAKCNKKLMHLFVILRLLIVISPAIILLDVDGNFLFALAGCLAWQSDDGDGSEW